MTENLSSCPLMTLCHHTIPVVEVAFNSHLNSLKAFFKRRSRHMSKEKMIAYLAYFPQGMCEGLTHRIRRQEWCSTIDFDWNGMGHHHNNIIQVTLINVMFCKRLLILTYDSLELNSNNKMGTTKTMKKIAHHSLFESKRSFYIY